MIGYDQLEIKSPRRNFIDWLRSFSVGEKRVISPSDRKSLSAIISRLHRGSNGEIKFTITSLQGDIFVKRLK